MRTTEILVNHITLLSATALLIFAPVCSTARAQEDHAHSHHHPQNVHEVRPAAFYAPTAMPDRVILTLNEDPCTSQTVTWRTSTEVVTGFAEIAEAGAGPEFTKNAKRHEANSDALKSDLNTAHYHSVVFRELKPGTVYAYRVGDRTNWSEWFHFRTASEKPEPFSFVYFGDAQNDIRSMWSRVIREAYRDAPESAFLLHAGDLINVAQSDANWGEWFGAGAWMNGMIPSVAAAGNHEHFKKKGSDRRHLSDHWRKVFTFPENGPRGLEETCFTLTYHNLRIVVLNSNEMLEEQATWMDEVLSESKSQWVVCTFHHPIYSTGRGRDNANLREIWKPVFDKHKVDLVLQGHDHTYGRTGFEVPDATAEEDDFPTSLNSRTESDTKSETESGTESGEDTNVPTGVTNIDEETGTVYVVSVSGPKMYDNTRYEFMKRIAEDTQLYQVIKIDGDTLSFEARTAIGELYDAFELKKQEGGINKLTEIKPEVGRNMRPVEEQPADK